MRLAALLPLLVLTGCATAARWTPCPDRLNIGGSYHAGTISGSDFVARNVSGGEWDGSDSNYRGYEARADVGFALGLAPSECRTWGGELPE